MRMFERRGDGREGGVVVCEWEMVEKKGSWSRQARPLLAGGAR